MTRVLIADDHPLVRQGLTRVLDKYGDMEIVGEVASADAVLEAVEATKPDVLLLDVNMPGPGFLHVLESLRQRHSELRTLIISGHSEALYARRALRSGAAGYISKERAADDLVDALRVVASGGHYVSPEMASTLAANLSTDNRQPHEALSPREYEIMLLLVAGHTVTDIAGRLNLSVKTVSTHRSNLLGKMKLETNADLVRYARAHDLGIP